MPRKPPFPLFVTEAELAAVLGLSVEQWKATAIVLERSGLPLKDPQFGDRRYFPAVVAYLDRRAGIMEPAINTPDMEDFTQASRRPRRKT